MLFIDLPTKRRIRPQLPALRWDSWQRNFLTLTFSRTQRNPWPECAAAAFRAPGSLCAQVRALPLALAGAAFLLGLCMGGEQSLCAEERPSASCLRRLLPQEGRAGSQGLFQTFISGLIRPLNCVREHLSQRERTVFLHMSPRAATTHKLKVKHLWTPFKSCIYPACLKEFNHWKGCLTLLCFLGYQSKLGVNDSIRSSHPFSSIQNRFTRNCN